jgi:hypothetical protein
MATAFKLQVETWEQCAKAWPGLLLLTLSHACGSRPELLWPRANAIRRPSVSLKAELAGSRTIGSCGTLRVDRGPRQIEVEASTASIWAIFFRRPL